MVLKPCTMTSLIGSLRCLCAKHGLLAVAAIFSKTPRIAAMIAYAAVVLALAGCLIVGSLLVQWIGLPVPAALIGMLVLLAGLLCLPRVPAALARVSDWMLRNLVLWILPSALGVVAYGAALQAHWLPIVLASVIGTALTAAVTAWVFVVMLRLTTASQPVHEAVQTAEPAMPTRLGQPDAADSAAGNHKETR